MNRAAIALVATVATFALAAPASAQYVDRDDSARFEDDFQEDEFMINFRGHALVVPGFVLNWFWEEHENHWTKGKTNFAWGGELTWRRRGEFELGLGVDWVDLRMPDGWWQDKQEPRSEADWTQVELQMLSIQFFTRWFWDVQDWLSPFVGVGLGPGIIFGDILKYNPSAGSTCRSALQSGDFPPPDDQCLDDEGQPDATQFDAGQVEETVPPLVPVLAVGAGLRFNIADYGMIKIEMGFQDYFYLGAGAGVQW